MFFIKKYKKELYENKLLLIDLRFEISKLKQDFNLLRHTCKFEEREYIIYKGCRYNKVSKKADHGDVIIVKSMTAPSSYVQLNKPYEVFCNYKGVAFIERDYLAAVYHEGFGRTENTVDVYELVDNG